MSEEARSDPFAMTASPAAYVPRAATERALDALSSSLGGGAPVVVLSGPAGLGKTLLLRLLEPRLRGRRTLVYLPYAALPAADLCAWALTVLGRPAAGDSVAAIGALARDLAARGAPLVLVLDDGSAIPLETARSLADLATETPGVLSLLVALTDDAKSEAVIAALGPDARSLRLEEPLTATESAAYIAARLAHAGTSDQVRHRFDAVLLDRLHRAARGVPRVLHRLASEVVRRGTEALLALDLDEPALEPESTPKRAEPPPPTPAAARVAVLEAEGAVLPAQTARSAEPTPKRVDPVSSPAAPPPEPAPAVIAPRPERAEVPQPLGPRPSARAPSVAAPRPAPEKPPHAPEERKPAPTPEAAPPTPPRPAPARVPAASGRAIGPLQIFLVALVVGAAAIGIPLLLSRSPAPQSPPPPTASAKPAPSAAAPPAVRPPAPVKPSLPPAPTNPAPLPKAPPAAPPPAPTPAAQPSTPPPAASREPAPVAPQRPAASPQPAPAPEPPKRLPEAVPPTPPPPMAKVEPAPAAALPAPKPVPAVPPVAVAINATPWATIEIDGREVGDTPLAGISLPPGPHVFRAKLPDGRVVERKVEISARNRFVTFQ